MRILLLISLLVFSIFARVKTDKIQAKDSVIVVEDSSYFAGGLRGLRLYMQTARIEGTATATQFSGPLTGNVTGNLTGNVTGNVSGSSGSCTGNSATATTATTATNITGNALVDWSSSAEVTGWDTLTTKVVKYSVVGKMVTLYFDLSGESNSQFAKITLPFIPINDKYYGVAKGRDNGTSLSNPCLVAINPPAYGYVVEIGKDWYVRGFFTAYGTKSVSGSITYSVY